MPSATYAAIRAAILAKQQIVCTFNGYRREMCPHAIGLNKRGEEQVFSFQFAGESSKILPREGAWRCMPVAEVQGLVVRDGPWFTMDSHSKPQTCVDRVDVEVAY